MGDETPWLDADEGQLWRDWIHAQAAIELAVARDLRQSAGLGHGEYEILAHLSESPDRRLRFGDLASLTGWERSRASHQLARMEKRGLVSREDTPGDRRGSMVVLTDAGFQAIQQAAPQHVRAVRSAFVDRLDEKERAVLATVLRRLQE